MKLGIFCYNFNHWKTQVGLQNLILHNFKPTAVFAADPVKLNFYRSKIRITPKDLFLIKLIVSYNSLILGIKPVPIAQTGS